MAIAPTTHRILIFAEDPGAVNFIRPVISCLRDRGAEPMICATGIAAEIFDRESTPYQRVTGETHAASLLEQIRPNALLVGTAENPRTFAFDLIDQAKHQRIRSWGYVDSAANHDFRFRGESMSPTQHLPDSLLVIDERSKEKFLSLGINAEQIFVCGHPNYDRVRSFAREHHQQRTPPANPGGNHAAEIDAGANTFLKRTADSSRVEHAGRTRVFFLAEISDAIGEQTYRRDADYTLVGSGAYQDRTSIVLETFLAAMKPHREQTHLVLRLHPKNKQSDFPDLRKQFDEIQQGGCSLTAMLEADLVVGMTTALIDEAALLEIPTLSITPRSIETEWCSSISWGATPAVHDLVALGERLTNFFELGRFRCPTAKQLPQEGAAQAVAGLMLSSDVDELRSPTPSTTA